MVDPVNSMGYDNNVSANKSSLGKDDFMKLMIQQLKNQDPLSPMDGTQFAAQLAQFSSLEQLSNLNSAVKESMDANYLLTQSINNTLMAAMVGKEVKLAGSNIQVNGQDSVQLGYTLPADAKLVSVKIYNENGALVKTFEDVPASAGDSKLIWDLYDNNGNKLPNGNYSFNVEATDYTGQSMTVDTYKTGIIDGVRFTAQGTVLIVGGAVYSVNDITEVLNSKDGGGN